VAADVCWGAPNFSTYVNPDITQQQTGATASTMLSPVSVTSDGARLFVTDLGFNRVLIFNAIPSTNGAAADVALGQPDMVSSLSNNAYTGTAATRPPIPPIKKCRRSAKRPTEWTFTITHLPQRCNAP